MEVVLANLYQFKNRTDTSRKPIKISFADGLAVAYAIVSHDLCGTA
jgi:hypothetical protein